MDKVDDQLTQNITQHIANAIKNSVVNTEPYPYIFVENIFPDIYYTQIMDNMQKSDKYYTQSGKSEYKFRMDINVPDSLKRASTLDFFNTLKSILSTQLIFNSFFEQFKEQFKDKFGTDNIQKLLKPTLLLAKYKNGYYLGPHTDRYDKVITCVFYFPENENLEHLGTAMYKPKKEDFTCKGRTHHDFENFRYTHTVPYKANSALIFFRNDKSFHGVEKISDMIISERLNIQYNLWLNT